MVRLSFFVCVVAAASALGRIARAEAPLPLTWATSVDAACPIRPALFAREVDLACDAAGGTCRRVVGETRIRGIALKCADADRWTVEARDERGAYLWTLTVDGAPASRARTAAMWIARASRDAPPPGAPLVVTPPARVAAATDRASPEVDHETPAPSRPTAAPDEATPVRSKIEPSRSTQASPALAPAAAHDPTRSMGLTVSPGRETDHVAPPDATHSPSTARGRGGVALAVGSTTSNGIAGQSLEGTARVAFALPKRANAGLALAAARSVGGGDTSFTTGRIGFALGWGAPWTTGLLGAWLEAGIDLGAVERAASMTPARRFFVDPYASLALVVAAPTSGALRPWIALAVTALARPIRVTEANRDVASSSQASLGFDVGAAWAAF